MADLVLENASVLTMTAPGARAEAVWIHDGQIGAVGARAAVLAEAPAAARRVDLGGAVVLPSLTDSHLHLLSYGLFLSEIDCARGSIAELVDAVRQRAGRTPPGQWLVGRGWDQERFAERRYPNRWDLDEAAPQHPVILRRYCGHVAVANSLALRLAGVGAATADPPAGVIDRDASGEPTGMLREDAMGLVERMRPAPDAAARKAALVAAVRSALAYGITTVHTQDAWRPGETEEVLELYRAAARDEGARIRLYALFPAAEAPALAARGLRTGSGDEFVRLGPAKLFADGSLGGGTAALGEPYADAPETRGVLMYPQDELNELVRAAHAAGNQVAVHTIGDRATDCVLEAFAAAQRDRARADARFRAIHLQVLREGQVRRLKELGVIADIQPKFATSDGLWAERRLGPERLALAYALRTFLDAGIPACAGSDCPVEPLDPWLGLEAAVRHEDPAAGVSAEWLRREGVDAWRALRLFTADAAYAEFREGRKGIVAPGALADLIVVDRDPTAIPPEEIRRVRVQATILGGEVAHGDLGVG
jgi:predicted amidohydrolase YtcJ